MRRRAGTRNDIERYRNERCASETDQFDEEKTTHHSADDGSESVQSVQAGDALSNVGVGRDEVTGQQRQGHSHEQRHGNQSEEGKPESDERHFPRGKRKVCASKDRRDGVECERHEHCETGNGDLECSVD